MMKTRWPIPLRALGTAAWLILALPAQAGPLSAITEVTETMMEVQGAEASLIGRLFGSDPKSPLSFTSSMDFTNYTFSFSLNPGSTYLGNSITLSGSGSGNATTGVFTWSTTGSLAGTLLGGSGTVAFTGGNAVDVASWVIGGVELDREAHISVVGGGQSTSSIYYTVTAVVVAKTQGRDNIVGMGDPRDWQWMEDHVNVNNFNFCISSSGSFSPNDGSGSFTTSILPESSGPALLGLAILTLGAYGWNRRSKVAARTSPERQSPA
jgi:hypothetical protein